ncbi:hypothetical protein [Leptospira ilyithenensis]|uniref:Uncharacterized protein n=1 Tax=Leptospira ilyithenensis TaxID=2484901 RepID=A0A4R9LPS5_9LEPT|nr:hypothetical protein [Leptospira ilyithenensis]TGN09392.1 hypothetical protein EHS11_12650 [Leptospira ilyithenensis]
MPDSSENPLENFSLEDSTISQKEEWNSGAAILGLPKNQGRFSLTAQLILEELRVRHQRLAMHGSSEIAPSLLLTLDSISELLLKAVQLTENHKTPEAISEALKELSDFGNGFKDRSVYFYPYFLKTDTGLVVRVALVAPQNKEKTDIIPYRRACFKYSQDIIAILMKNFASRETVIDEEKPGARLLYRDGKGILFLNPNGFSFESDAEFILKKGFEPYFYIPLPDFIVDLVSYASASSKLYEINKNYHIVLSQNSFLDTLFKHIAVQLDALSGFSFHYLKKFAKENKILKALDQIEDLETKIPSSGKRLVEGGWKFAYELIFLIKGFPFDQIKSDELQRVKDSCFASIAILEKLLNEIQSKGKDILETKIAEIIIKIKNRVMDHTEKTLSLSLINLEQEIQFLRSLPKFEEKSAIEQLQAGLSKSLGVTTAGVELDKGTLVAVDQKYFSDVVMNTKDLALKDPVYKEHLVFLEEIKRILKERKDENFDTLSENKEPNDSSPKKEIEKEETKTSAFNLAEIQKNFNLPVGIITALSGSVLSMIIAIALNRLNSLLTGLFASIMLGVILAYVLRKDDSKKTNKDKSSAKNHSAQEERFLSLIKASESFIYPKKYNHLLDKVYDPKKLRNRIEENLSEIKNLLSAQERKKDDQKIISEVEHAILQISAVVRIPEALQIKGRTKEIIVGKADLKTTLFRDNLAEYYRKEASAYHSDKDMVNYFNFVIREIELGYSKYIK